MVRRVLGRFPSSDRDGHLVARHAGQDVSDESAECEAFSGGGARGFPAGEDGVELVVGDRFGEAGYAGVHGGVRGGDRQCHGHDELRAALILVGVAAQHVVSQNLRLGWTDLQVRNLVIDRPSIDDEELPADQFANTRLVVLRTNDRGEVPQRYGIAEDDDIPEETDGRVFGRPSGLWRIPGLTRTFTSTASRPDSAKRHGSPMGSHRHGRFVEREDPDTGELVQESYVEVHKSAYNPQGIQITAAWLEPGDDPLTWAAITHAHRDLVETYDDTLVLPHALHLAKKALENAFPPETRST